MEKLEVRAEPEHSADRHSSPEKKRKTEGRNSIKIIPNHGKDKTKAKGRSKGRSTVEDEKSRMNSGHAGVHLLFYQTWLASSQ